MNITWAGHACFKIEGSALTIIIDPFDPSLGLKFSHKKADVVLSSSPDPYHGNVDAVKEKGESKKVITTPGEYEIQDVFIYGMMVAGDAVIFRIEIDGLSLVHLGALSEPLQNSQLDHLEKTDILFVPIGGGKYLNAVKAHELTNQIEPKIIIPMCYKIPGIKLPLDGIEKFYKEMGIKPKEVISKLKIHKKDIHADMTDIAVLSAE